MYTWGEDRTSFGIEQVMNQDPNLSERANYLEALLQYTINRRAISLQAGSENVEQLHAMVSQVLQADFFAVMIADAQQEQMHPGLGIKVPASYIDTCNQNLQATRQDKRLLYVAEEVLYRSLPTDQDSPAAREAAALNFKSYMRLPIVIREDTKGFIAFGSHSPERFNGASIEYGRFFADLIATLVENDLLRQHYRRTEDFQQAAYKMAVLINNELSLQEVLREVVQETLRLTAAATALILLVREDGSLSIAAQAGDTKLLKDSRQMAAFSKGQIGTPIDATTIEQYQHYQADLQKLFVESVAGGLLGTPLIGRNRLLGMLVVLRAQDHLMATSDQEIMEMLAPLAATAIDKAQLRDTVRHERMQLQALLNHVSAPIFVVNRRGTLVMANPEAHKVAQRIGISFYQMIGHSMREVVAQLPPEVQIPQRFPIGEALEVDLGEGGEFVMRVAEVPDADGRTENYVVVGQEVTKERRLDRAKSDLLYVLSHDIGNILTLGLGYAGFAIEEDGIELSLDEYRFTVKKIYEALVRARSLILDVVALEASYEQSIDGRILRPFYLGEILRAIYDTYLSFARDKEQSLRYEVEEKPPLLKGNPALIKQALENLVTNAIKYTPDGGTVSIRLGMAREDVALVSIEDSGLGIPEEALPHIWERYYRVESHKKLQPGSGVGLSLVKSVVDEHGGWIEVESAVNKGSRFKVYLPLNHQEFDPTLNPLSNE